MEAKFNNTDETQEALRQASNLIAYYRREARKQELLVNALQQEHESMLLLEETMEEETIEVEDESNR